MVKFFALVIIVISVAGCSALPGLRVLSGEEPAPSDIAQVVEDSDLVMADKTGSTDPSLMAAANRVEAASGNVDLIEIRKDDANDAFVMNMLFNPPQDASSQTQQGMVSLYTAIQRAIELSWQGTLAESQGSGLLRISFIQSQSIPTLDNNGSSFVGFILLNTEIERSDAIAYLSGSRTLSDFLDLIANGTMAYESPQETQIYAGQPNHPLFMIPAAAAAQQPAQ